MKISALITVIFLPIFSVAVCMLNRSIVCADTSPGNVQYRYFLPCKNRRRKRTSTSLTAILDLLIRGRSTYNHHTSRMFRMGQLEASPPSLEQRVFHHPGTSISKAQENRQE